MWEAIKTIIKLLPEIVDLIKKFSEFIQNQQAISALNKLFDNFKEANENAQNGDSSDLENFFGSGGVSGNPGSKLQ